MSDLDPKVSYALSVIDLVAKLIGESETVIRAYVASEPISAERMIVSPSFRCAIEFLDTYRSHTRRVATAYEKVSSGS